MKWVEIRFWILFLNFKGIFGVGCGCVVFFIRLVNLRVNYWNIYKLVIDFVKYFMMKSNYLYFINIKSCIKDSFI